MMISSVDGSNAISHTPQMTENKAPVELVKKSSTSAKVHAHKVAQGQLKNSVKSEVSDVSIKSNDSNNVDTGSIAAKNNANVAYLKSKTDSSNTNDNSSSSTITYGQHKDDEEETYYSKDTSYIPTSFEELAAMVGGGAKVTKEQLNDYLRSLTSIQSTASAADITIVKNLIAQFDDLSGGTGFVTSFKGTKDIQDYTTVTKDQVTSPIDVRV